ncbi:hypothetical protein Pan216_17600 [Planctomycetes bacterium Pan216]|uniref:Xylose isomerase-like TIM barrel domain-containing protein n=1 Tax=Kolteria novifilia TaxID=2527975 RepID=A0A518B1Q1_9BACT|nr:hypothetical protein Pan216_17600 [Planctomycetes bacterium Pan216]
MDVACSTLCFTDEPLEQALRHIAGMEFGRVELVIADHGPHLNIDEVMSDSAAVIRKIRQGPQINVCAVTTRIDPMASDLGERIDEVAHLAKQLQSPVVSVEAAATGTPIEQEVERLTALEKICSRHGTLLAVNNTIGTLTELPEVAIELCNRVQGLGVCLDPGYYISGPHQGKDYEEIFPFVRHVQLRDSGRGRDQLQIKVGRGEVEYGRLISALHRYRYRGALCVKIEKDLAEGLDIEIEVRKLRLVLESLVL